MNGTGIRFVVVLDGAGFTMAPADGRSQEWMIRHRQLLEPVVGGVFQRIGATCSKVCDEPAIGCGPPPAGYAHPAMVACAIESELRRSFPDDSVRVTGMRFRR